ncbi:hypothetical protein E1281_37840 [Actinomadura sp. KC345]|uniref:hypothetical protein n=1 Tax=Actinomadura sp. KC345 TaxID=2530371 RepID=UPI00104452D0|nr:hypothetical protein [Actinomadura sp. KC345]TDC40974.1 hypothetical protein E1281_37840 [Actinomadura sp. KC345]
MLPRIRRRRAGLLALTAAGVLTGSAPPAAADTAPRWSPDLAAIGGDDVNVRHDGRALRLGSARTGPAALHDAQATGQLLLAPRDLAEPVNRVRARVDGGGSAAVDVRAWRGGSWTEWYPAGAALPSASTRIQARIVLAQKAGAPAPAVSGVELTAARVAAPAPSAAAAAAHRVFATREGLVGATTANGHVITERDHFVALPSRRGLSPKGTGDYSVRVCTDSGSRCEYAPVWDVGPWNTRDDYWNPSSVREMWKDLPQGTPESQAAYEDGYNGGKDEFGRTVLNPAGIDLADGTFWDGLGLTDNAWVNVTYLWTGTGPKGVVGASGAPVTLRSSASESAAATGTAADHANVVVECHVRGENVTGTYGTSDLWNRIGPGHFIPDVYLDTGSDDPVAPAC